MCTSIAWKGLNDHLKHDKSDPFVFAVTEFSSALEHEVKQGLPLQVGSQFDHSVLLWLQGKCIRGRG